MLNIGLRLWPPWVANHDKDNNDKHYDDDNLSALLGKMNIGTPADRDAIMGLKRGNHFQLACAKHFEVTHPGAANMKDLSINGVGDHPNAWYAASVSYHAAKSGDGTKSSESG